ncbi:IS1380 family transposase [Babesia caballi]|uniref:IS1380 family transposase n=1 Tax=Babesia caballi TaxID=5871 RepID=A0AAV4LTP2_BABCB|nr:IS1380 family transposase [Babesia caballi]
MGCMEEWCMVSALVSRNVRTMTYIALAPQSYTKPVREETRLHSNVNLAGRLATRATYIPLYRRIQSHDIK